MEIEKIIRLAERKGADLSEVFSYRDKEISISISRGGRISSSSSISEGVGIRVIIKGREGFSYTSKIAENEIEKAIERAMKIALKSGRTLESLPEPAKPPKAENMYFKEVEEASINEIFTITSKVFGKALEHKGPGKIVSCRNSISFMNWRIANSIGVDYEFAETHNIMSFSAIATKNGVSATNYDYIYDRRLIDADTGLNKAIETIALAEKGVPETSIESGSYPVILHPIALTAILRYTLYPVLTAKFKPRRLSAGKAIGSDKFTLMEDPLNPKIPNSSPIDHEGTVREKRTIIERGKVVTLLYDHYYAVKENMKSTGNGFRIPILTWPRMLKPYQALPTPEIGSLVIEKGKRSIDELASQAGKGLYVIYVIGAHGADPASGRFSATAGIAFKIENGSISKPVKHATISGDLEKLLNIVDMSSETRNLYEGITPAVLVEKLRIAGE